MTQDSSFGSHLRRAVQMLVIPQGYTLSIAGSFAMAVHRYGFPNPLKAWDFIAGAVFAFVLLALIAHGGGGNVAALPMGLVALMNVVPLLVVAGVAELSALISSPFLGFPVVGLAGAGGYVVLLAAFLWVVSRAEVKR